MGNRGNPYTESNQIMNKVPAKNCQYVDPEATVGVGHEEDLSLHLHRTEGVGRYMNMCAAAQTNGERNWKSNVGP